MDQLSLSESEKEDETLELSSGVFNTPVTGTPVTVRDGFES